MRHSTLADWLAWQETLHPNSIDLELDRVRAVADALGLLQPACPVITVAGTNGKGSAVAMYESVLLRAGYRSGAYTSPHLRCYNERIRIAGRQADDRALCESFARIDAARGPTTLTYFEFGTLAALDLFARREVDVLVLEVGLGGRLDAVNIVDADLAHFGSIGIDHIEWLGNDRESIGAEKAGILRPGIPAVCADREPPASLLAAVRERSAQLALLGRDFDWRRTSDGLRWQQGDVRLELPSVGLPGAFQCDNAATVIAGLMAMAPRLPITVDALREGLASVWIEGRFQHIAGPVPTVVDVAHNPNAAAILAQALAAEPVAGRTLAVVAMLADKDVETVTGMLRPQIDRWYAASVGGSRGLNAQQLAERLQRGGATDRVAIDADIIGVWQHALDEAAPGDRIVVFGSFYAIGDFLNWWHARA
jgi:dihydrofolate synthase/folylpolyglutamate synthase